MIAISILSLVACSDQSLWNDGSAPSGEPDPVFQDDGDEGDWEDDGDDTGAWEDEGDDGPWTGQWGEVVLNGSTVAEAYTGFFDWDGTAALCDVAYPLEGGTPVSDCPDCTIAGTFTLGAPEIETNVDGRCEALGWTGLEGQVLTIGHGDPETLWSSDGGSWQPVGWSTNAGGLWEFEIELLATVQAEQPDDRALRGAPVTREDRRPRPIRP